MKKNIIERTILAYKNNYKNPCSLCYTDFFAYKY